MKYSDKLKDPRWQKKRLQVMEKANFKCVQCGDSKNTLAVHHMVYIKGKEPWDYQDDLLKCFCEKCHEYQHGLTQEMALLSGMMDLNQLGSTVGYMYALTGIVHKNKKMVQFANIEMAVGYFSALFCKLAAEMAEKTVPLNGLLTEDSLIKIVEGYNTNPESE
jgi:hypothetical protein